MKIAEGLAKFRMSALVPNTFAQHFYQNVAFVSQENGLLRLRYKVEPYLTGPSGSLSSGAGSTLIDAATTIHLLKLTRLRTISISLSGTYFGLANLAGQELIIESEIGKMGKDICFTRARGLVQGKSVFEGEHVKKVLDSEWAHLA